MNETQTQFQNDTTRQSFVDYQTYIQQRRNRKRLTFFLLALIGTIILAFATSCAGAKAREVSMPLAGAILERVLPDVERGLQGELALVTISQEVADAVRNDSHELVLALQQEDKLRVDAVDWARVLTYAALGVHDRLMKKEVGDAVAQSLAERVIELRNLLNLISPRN